MSLGVYSRYYNPTLNQTIVAVHDTDASVFVKIDAQLDGNLIELPENELLDRAMSWFTNRYINEYAAQKLDEKMREVEHFIKELKLAIQKNEESTKSNEEKVDTAVAELTNLIVGFMTPQDDEETNEGEDTDHDEELTD